MNKDEFYKKLDEIFELDLGTINGGESLSEGDLIDSLSLLGLIALLDKDFNVQMEAKAIVSTGTIDDLFHAVSTQSHASS
jgi:acyl carrier protein